MHIDTRQRAHDLVRSELAEAAFDVIVDHGFDELTADDLAKRLGVSRATFFRYLGSKDEVVIAAMIEPDDVFAAAYSGAGGSGSRTWRRLRSAVQPAVARANHEPQRMRARIALIQSQVALGARLRRARAPQIDRLASAIEASGLSQLSAAVLAAATIATLDRCWVEWARSADSSIEGILDQAFAALESAARG